MVRPYCKSMKFNQSSFLLIRSIVLRYRIGVRINVNMNWKLPVNQSVTHGLVPSERLGKNKMKLMLNKKKLDELNMIWYICIYQIYRCVSAFVSNPHTLTRKNAYDQIPCCHINKKLFKLLMNFKMTKITIALMWKILFTVQLQQIASAKGRIRTEACALTSSGGKWKDGKMAIHTTMRRIIGWNQETTKWGESMNCGTEQCQANV